MELSDLISLKKFTPLSKTEAHLDTTAFLNEALYRLSGGGIYLNLTKFGGPNFEARVGGSFLVGIFIAPDDGAMKRVVNSEIEMDSELPLMPPALLLPSDISPEYGSILNWLNEMNPTVCQEVASYRIASDGLFVHRTIETEKYTFYFRGADFDAHEAPYAALYKLQ